MWTLAAHHFRRISSYCNFLCDRRQEQWIGRINCYIYGQGQLNVPVHYVQCSRPLRSPERIRSVKNICKENTLVIGTWAHWSNLQILSSSFLITLYGPPFHYSLRNQEKRLRIMTEKAERRNRRSYFGYKKRRRSLQTRRVRCRLGTSVVICFLGSSSL